MQKNLITVIVPVYKAEEYLRECVDSIIAQKYTNLEIILINDGSPDQSGSICDEYAAADNRVRVIHKENGGCASARNAGIDIAQGEFIAFVDSDDTISEDMYERMHRCIIENSADLCISGFARIYENTISKRRVPTEEKISTKQFYGRLIECTDQYRDVMFPLWNKLYKRELILKGKNSGSELAFSSVTKNSTDVLFNVDYFALIDNGIVFDDFTPYSLNAKRNHFSVSKVGVIEDEYYVLRYLQDSMTRIFPEKASSIEYTINYMKDVAKVKFRHYSVIYKHTNPYDRVTFSSLMMILRNSTYLTTKLSALLLCILPAPLYRAVFKMY